MNADHDAPPSPKRAGVAISLGRAAVASDVPDHRTDLGDTLLDRQRLELVDPGAKLCGSQLSDERLCTHLLVQGQRIEDATEMRERIRVEQRQTLGHRCTGACVRTAGASRTWSFASDWRPYTRRLHEGRSERYPYRGRCRVVGTRRRHSTRDDRRDRCGVVVLGDCTSTIQQRTETARDLDLSSDECIDDRRSTLVAIISKNCVIPLLGSAGAGAVSGAELGWSASSSLEWASRKNRGKR